MPTVEKIVWTALPNGVAGTPPNTANGLMLSVFIAPRLRPDPTATSPTLGLFPDFLDWPATLSKVQFAVQFAGGPTLTARPHPRPRLAPNSVLWRKVFPPSTPIQSHTLDDYTSRFVLSYPVQNVLSFVKGAYQQVAVATQPDQDTGLQQLPLIQPPPNAQLGGTLQAFLDPGLALPENTGPGPTGQPIKGLQDRLLELEALYHSPTSYNALPNPAYPGSPDPTGEGLNVDQQSILLGRLFHYVDPRSPRVPLSSPALDFHKIVSSLGDYPAILRLLGLVVDLIVPFTASIPAGGSSTTVQLVPGWTPAPTVAVTDIRPQTAYTLDGTNALFFIRPQGSGISNGMLNLSDPSAYDLVQVDPDGTTFKVVNLATQLQQAERMRSADTPTRAGLPALRSGGLSVVSLDRAYSQVLAFRSGTQKNAAFEANSPVTLFAENVTRGWRIDVWDSSTAVWRSLCQRRGTYSFPTAPRGLQTLTIDDEGFATMGMTEKPSGGGELHLPQSLFHWQGWSLAAPRPGGMLDPGGHPARMKTTPQPGFEFAASFAALLGSLPHLRFGHPYQVRARIVDLAGNSVPLGSTDAAEAVPKVPLQYRRFEPVVAPAVVLRNAISGSPGEATRHLVIRSDFDKTDPQTYLTYVVSLGLTGLRADCQRHIAPPRTSQLMAETHGKFDTAGGLDTTAYNTIASLDADFKADGIYDVDQLSLPYLPDPISRGAVFVGLPGTPASPGFEAVTFAGSWPGATPFRIQVVGIPQGQTPAPPSFGNGVLQVQVPQAEQVTVNLSSLIGAADLEQMGIWGWIEENNPPNLAELRNLAQTGRHWMITPHTELFLVNAVQRPLKEPDFTVNLSASRHLGETFVTLNDLMPIDGKSTNKLDVNARWSENWDDPSDPRGPGDPINNPSGPGARLPRAHAFQVPVEPTMTSVSISSQHHFGDTKHRTVFYTPTATSRFREFFEIPVTNPDGTTTTAVQNGTLPITRDGAEVKVDVLSSARPNAPRVRYVIPAFEWSSQTPAQGPTKTRLGKRLRVYLERGWYSSGDGELLGVICLPPAGPTPFRDRMRSAVQSGAIRMLTRSNQSPSDLAEALKPYITMWGNDPIWAFSLQQQLVNPPSITNFPLAVMTQKGVTVDGVPGLHLDVAGHSVGYDTDRGLWYCDIEVDAGNSYYPFARLALARYQPDSITYPDPITGQLQDVYISRIILADFVQLAPDRVASLVFDPKNNSAVTVSVTGVTFTQSDVFTLATNSYDTSTTMDVTVEEQAPNGTGDLGWVPFETFSMPPTLNGTQTTWQTSVNLPAPRGSQPFRLVIKEYERFYGDPDPTNPFSQAPKVPRLVYASTFEL